jgi:prefoldin alpha subunit
MAGESSNNNAIDLDSMSLEQLNQLKTQEENRLQALAERYSQLRHAAGRISASAKAVNELQAPDTDGRDVLVPLTESVYVPGKIRDPNNLLVELGTGYYCEKSGADTVAFLERKQRLVDANSANITKAVQATRQNIEAVTTTMQGKLMQVRARQEGTRYRASVESGDN